MKTLEQRIRIEKAAVTFWAWFLAAMAFLVLIPFLPMPVPAEAGFAAAFFGLLFGIIAIVMVRIFVKNKRAALAVGNPGNIIGQWLSPDRYHQNKGQPVQTVFTRQGVFYAGRIYPAHSYACRIEDSKIADDEGPVLRIVYSAGTRYGRARHHLDIPIPEDGEDEAVKLADFYKTKGQD